MPNGLKSTFNLLWSCQKNTFFISFFWAGTVTEAIAVPVCVSPWRWKQCIFCPCVWVCGTMSQSDSSLSVRRCFTFATGLVECLCFAGAVFGWASLVFVLKTESYFSSLCVNTTGVNATHALGRFDVLISTTSECLFASMLQKVYHLCKQLLKMFEEWRIFLCRPQARVTTFTNHILRQEFCVYRLQWTGWTVLTCFHHRLLYEQFPDSTQWFPLWSLWYLSGSALRNVSPTTALITY